MSAAANIGRRSGPVVAAPAVELHPVAVLDDLEAIAVELRLMQPGIARGMALASWGCRGGRTSGAHFEELRGTLSERWKRLWWPLLPITSAYIERPVWFPKIGGRMPLIDNFWIGFGAGLATAATLLLSFIHARVGQPARAEDMPSRD